ncbi:hypothetical protein IMSAGC019_00725 [Lachnospiraceae bacterium]|nr:hypothetical protein IMSAGC019_00725 [Lachnospiraceae bacterium]
MAIEAWGSIYFFDTFLKKKDVVRLEKCRHIILYAVVVAVAFLGEYFVSMGIKVLLMVLILMVFCTVFYKAEWKQRIFFSVLNYSLMFLTDLFMLQMENMFISQNDVPTFLLLPSKMLWLCLVFIVRKIWKGQNNYGELSRKEWLKFSMIPLLTLASMLLMFFCNSAEAKVQTAYLFLSVGLIFINILVIELLQGILEKEELFRESALAGQKKESQLAHYRDMQAVYERQGRKMHDYKNQIRTMQVLLKKGDTQAAAALAERLTESISVEMAAVSTNHPVVDAVLNQKFHAAREQGVSMTFRVGDMGGLRLNEEETVILLSNLLDNAIHECVKVVKAGRKAVIHVKLVQEGGKLIFSVRNPVEEKVEAVEGTGLSNVKAVADKYGGDFAVSCDEEKFQAVVML